MPFTMDDYGNAIKSIESGGDYSQVTPNPNGNDAIGAYQVLKSNIPSWTQAALGYSMSPDQFKVSIR